MKKYLSTLTLIAMSALGMQDSVENGKDRGGSCYKAMGSNQHIRPPECISWKQYPMPSECVTESRGFASNPVFFLPVCMKEPPKESCVVVSQE